MNALCLLTKGHTFREMADRPGAYKLLSSRALPKFMAGGRRLAPEPQTAQTTLFEQPAKVVKIAPPEPVVSKSPFAPVAPCTGSTWTQMVSTCTSMVERLVFGGKGRPVHRATVQTELALEKVTVLRNDLNEDDLEVVLVERKVGTGEKPLARLSRLEMTGAAWIRLTAPFRKKDNENAFSPKATAKGPPELSAQS